MILLLKNESKGSYIYNPENNKNVFLQVNSSNNETTLKKLIVRADIRLEVAKCLDLKYLNDYKVAVVNSIPNNNTDERSSPVVLFQEITPYCNLSCKHCFQKMRTKSPTQDSFLSNIQILDILENALSIGITEYRLCGKEPTASPVFKKYVDKVIDAGRIIAVNTNGTFSREIADYIIQKKNIVVHFSLDGVTPEENDEIRGRGTFNTVTRNIKYLYEAGIECVVNYVVAQENLHRVENLPIILPEGCIITLFPYRSFSTANSNLTEITRRQNLELHLQLQKMRIKGVRISSLFDFLVEGKSQIRDIERAPYSLTPCTGRCELFIDIHGNYYPCDLIKTIGDEYKLGTYPENSILDIWNNSLNLSKFRLLQNSQQCMTCDHHNKSCFSGCIANRLANQNELVDETCFAREL